jgi:hypothetical protein
MLRTFIQVLALSLALMSSFFLIKGTVTLSVNDLAELSLAKYGYNLNVLKNLSANRADTVVGFCLLIGSFLLQMANMLWALRWCDFDISKKGVLLALVASLIIGGASLFISHLLQKHYYDKGYQVVKERVR